MDITDTNKCGNCLYYNGCMGDGLQFCDELEIFRMDLDLSCNRYKYADKSIEEDD